jgi:hypothetical protein
MAPTVTISKTMSRNRRSAFESLRLALGTASPRSLGYSVVLKPPSLLHITHIVIGTALALSNFDGSQLCNPLVRGHKLCAREIACGVGDTVRKRVRGW